MHYGIIKQQLLNINIDDRILIENLFRETTRSGKETLRYVQLALTPKTFIIGSKTILEYNSHRINLPEALSFYPLNSIKFSIFKKSSRNTLKVCFEGVATRYFELASNCKRKTFWNIWKIYVLELCNQTKIWPFTGSCDNVTKDKSSTSAGEDVPIWQDHPRWVDKYLYLGGRREVEDQHRPQPIAGLGSTEYIKLLNLKPQYFGCWAQSDHWVQCE